MAAHRPHDLSIREGIEKIKQMMSGPLRHEETGAYAGTRTFDDDGIEVERPATRCADAPSAKPRLSPSSYRASVLEQESRGAQVRVEQARLDLTGAASYVPPGKSAADLRPPPMYAKPGAAAGGKPTTAKKASGGPSMLERLDAQSRVTNAMDTLYRGASSASEPRLHEQQQHEPPSSSTASYMDWFDSELEQQKKLRKKRLAASAARRRAQTPEWQRSMPGFSDTQKYRDSVLEVVDVLTAGRALRRHERPSLGAADEADEAAKRDPLTPVIGPLTVAADSSLATRMPESGPPRAKSAPRSRGAGPTPLPEKPPPFMMPRTGMGSMQVGMAQKREQSGTDTRLQTFGALFHAVAMGALRPLRASYVVMLTRANEKMRGRPALPESAFWTHDELRKLLQSCLSTYGCDKGAAVFGELLVGFSYRWVAPDLPDNDRGFHLHQLGRMSETYLLGPPTDHRLDISKHPRSRPATESLTDAASWARVYREEILPACVPKRSPPLLPEVVARMLRSGVKACDHPEDAEALIELYEDFFNSFTRVATSLSFCDLGWGEEEVAALGRVLVCCSRCTHLDLSRNDLGPSGGKAVASMLRRTGCPVTRINLRHTNIDAASVEWMLTVGRLKAIELSELPLYSTRDVARLKLQKGQFNGQARLLIDERAFDERVWKIREAEKQEGLRHARQRHAHRHGWDEDAELEFNWDRPQPVMSSYGVVKPRTIPILPPPAPPPAAVEVAPPTRAPPQRPKPTHPPTYYEY